VKWTILIPALLLAFLAPEPPCRADDLSDYILFETGDALCGKIGSDGPVEKLSDRAHYEKVDRDGDRFYILLRYDDHHAWLKVFQCEAESGSVRKVSTIADVKIDPITAILSATILPDGRLFIETHVSPALCVAVAMDVTTGAKLILRGNRFTWDSTGRHIAYFLQPPTDDKPATQMQLWLDGKKLRDVPANDGADLTWDAGGVRLTATFPQKDKKDQTIVMRVGEKDAVAATN
jgi:hypothetical protein